MSDVVADTHIIIWYFFEPGKLSSPALKVLHDAQAAGGRILVSAITMVESTYLSERGRIAAQVLPSLWSAASDPALPFDILPVSATVARTLDQIPRRIAPDMPDRIIAATAVVHGIPLVSAYSKIRSLKVPGLTVIW